MTALFLRRATLVLLIGLLSGCAAKPGLIAKNASVPAGVDLSGYWELRTDDSNRRPLQMDGDSERLIATNRTKRVSRRRSSGGVSAHVFLEFGDDLKVTQTDFGLFISYDRSVVEEYRFGEHRLITIGPIEATRVSGWEASVFAVETLDDSGTTLFESWRLEQGGDVLRRDIRISKGEKNSFVHQQMFDRKQ